VGFPGETEDEFEELLDFAAEAQFDRMGAFAYSPEEGTAAAEMDDQIDEDIKAERLDEIMLMQQGIALEKNEERVGEETLVLCEGRKGKRYFGRSEKEAPESDGKILLIIKSMGIGVVAMALFFLGSYLLKLKEITSLVKRKK
jgi:ribosomal protein S12 methylthiotransferase